MDCWKPIESNQIMRLAQKIEDREVIHKEEREERGPTGTKAQSQSNSNDPKPNSSATSKETFSMRMITLQASKMDDGKCDEPT